MPIFASAFAGTTPPTSPNLSICEHKLTSLFQASTWPQQATKMIDHLATGLAVKPDLQPGRAIIGADATVMTIALGQWLIDCTDAAHFVTIQHGLEPECGTLTDLTHARACLLISGATALDLARKLAPVDFDDPAYAPGRIVQSGSAHAIDFMLYRQSDHRFYCYIERSYAHSFVDLLTAESAEFGAIASKP